ncbi:hypothetical protein JCM15765_02510 [Paradesulfitobacterium aromaticivorans]
MILGPDGRPLRKPVSSEIVSMQTDWIRFFKTLPNPDPILQRTGKGPEIYADMKIDPHVSACVFARKSGVLSKEWDVAPATQEPRDLEIAEFVKENLKNLNFDQDLRQMLEAPYMGFRAMEIMWEERAGRWWVQALKARPVRRFAFGIDGDLRVLSHSSLNDEPAPPAKFVLVQHEEDDENPYGERIFSRCYWPWVFKKHGFKFWAIFTEKYGMPTAVGKYQPGATPEDKNKLLEALDSLVQDAAVAIPANAELELKETSGDKAEVHRLFLTFCNAEISKAILGQTLTTEMGDTGSYSAAQVHQEVKEDIVEADAKMVMAALNDQLIRPLVEFNFGPQDNYPTFRIFYKEDDIQKDLAERDTKLVESGVPIGVNYFYNRYNIPQPEESEEVVRPLSRVQTATPQFKSQEKRRQLDFAQEEDKKIFERGDVLQGYYERSLERGKAYYGRLMREINQQIEGWHSLDEAKNLKVSNDGIEALADYLVQVALTGYMLGENDAWQDYEEAQRDFADPSPAPLDYTIRPVPLDLEEAVTYFSRLMPVDINQYRQLESELQTKYFTISQAEGQTTVERIKGYVQESLEKGTTLEEFKKDTNDLFSRMGLEPADPWHLETVFRTNVQTAYGAGNYEKFQDTELTDMFPYFRYSAVLDTHTRPAHRRMNGFVAAKDDPIWNEWWPPNGFNCRCGVVAINKYKAEREGIKPMSTAGLPVPDSGFAKNPGKALRSLPVSASVNGS